MGLFDAFIRKKKYRQEDAKEKVAEYEFCPRCNANLTLQKGYNNELFNWTCKGCGEMLINPLAEENVVWICDGCGATLNTQADFCEDAGHFVCNECGYDNKIDESEIYLSEEEFQADYNSPYKGLSDSEALELSMYSDVRTINNREDVMLVINLEDNRVYVKKILSVYDSSIYKYIIEHPIDYMPRVYSAFESNNNLIVIEEYIEGMTLLECMGEETFELNMAISIAKKICYIVKKLHTCANPIIHRDIKPSNIIIRPDGEVYLLDMNVAKWYKADEIEDTMLLGTQYYAAPEQLGYGFSASSEKSDIYAIGVLINVMLTGKYPKEKKADGKIWNVIEKCISLEPADRYTDDELIEALESMEG